VQSSKGRGTYPAGGNLKYFENNMTNHSSTLETITDRRWEVEEQSLEQVGVQNNDLSGPRRPHEESRGGLNKGGGSGKDLLKEEMTVLGAGPISRERVPTEREGLKGKTQRYRRLFKAGN